MDNHGNVEMFLKAVSFAARVHHGQTRKDGKTPYASHPFRVVMVLRHVYQISDERILTAAVLHDAIEDTPADFDLIAREFDPEIASWVGQLSKDMRKEEPVREAEYIEQLKKASLEAKYIKFADIYDNVIDAASSGVDRRLARTLKKARTIITIFEQDPDPKLQKPIEILTTLIRKYDPSSQRSVK